MTMKNYLELSRGCYQHDLLTGGSRWSGSDLKGNARKYAGRYAASRESLLARLVAAGFSAEVEDFRNANNRVMRVLYIDGKPVSAIT